MIEHEYERAVAKWISNQTGENPDLITDIKFASWMGGYCETCEYNTMGITYKLNTSAWTNDIEMEGISPAKFIREVSEIYQEMN